MVPWKSQRWGFMQMRSNEDHSEVLVKMPRFESFQLHFSQMNMLELLSISWNNVCFDGRTCVGLHHRSCAWTPSGIHALAASVTWKSYGHGRKGKSIKSPAKKWFVTSSLRNFPCFMMFHDGKFEPILLFARTVNDVEGLVLSDPHAGVISITISTMHLSRFIRRFPGFTWSKKQQWPNTVLQFCMVLPFESSFTVGFR